MIVRLKTRFVALMVGLCTLFVVALLAVRSEQRRSLGNLIAAQSSAAESMLDVLVESRRTQPATLASDYSLWNDMVTFVGTGDRAWAEENIDVGMSTFGAHAAWVFDAALNPVYATDAFEDTTLLLPVPIERLRARVIDGRDAFARFNAMTDHGVAELFTAPIQPSDDIPRATSPCGYFVVAKLWDEEELKTAGAIVGGSMRVETTPGDSLSEPALAEQPDTAEDRIVVSRKLSGIEGAEVARLSLALPSPLIGAARTDVDRLFVACTAFGIIVVLLVFFFFTRWVQSPLHRLDGALRTESTEDLGQVKQLAQEYQALCGLIERSIVQKAQLTGEVEQRRQVEAELVRERDRAERANVAKGQFLANMSHEIRTPLNGVLGMASLLIETPLNEEQRDLASTIRGSGEALLGVLNDILDFSKIEAGKLAIEAVPLAPRRIVDETLQLFAASAHAKGLALFSDLDASLPESVLGDPLRLRQVISNLVGNAIKFTQRGHIVVRAALVERAGDDVTLAFAVEDTGIGIPAAYVPQLFEAFSQADGTTSRRFGGTGLGLAICMRLATLMGGRIDVKSVEQQGTTFTFTLKTGRTPEVATEPAREWLRGQVALVVDACSARRAVVAKRLGELGLEVLVAAPDTDAVRAVLARNTIRFAVVAVDADQAPALATIDTIGSTSAETTCVALAPLGTTLAASHPGTARVAGTIPLPWGSEQLERRLAELIAGPLPRRGQSAPKPSSPQFDSGLLVLLAEDNPVNQKVARMTLKRLGLRCEIVGNGRLALEAVARTRFDLVLMDCQMPELDGYEATAALRALERDGAPRIPIIAMTANSMSSDRERCLAAGMDDYIPKPINFDELRATLARHLPAAASTARIPEEPAENLSLPRRGFMDVK